ncbi:MAG TPA: CsiV family protein [Candidatus Binatia bacterium]|nr:CsiV family protein [Candidatus Binatia bacterium]
MKRLSLLAAGLIALCTALPAQAEKYRVDLIVFLDQSGPAGESLGPPRTPDSANAFEPTEIARLRAAGIEILPDERFGLMQQWQRLKNSRRQEPVLRVAWLQKDPPAERGTALRLRWGQPLALTTASGASAIYPVDGTVALIAGHYLHLDAEFLHTQRTGGGDLGSFRLQEKRRVKRNELHHLDSPRLGLLVKVQKADAAPAKGGG